jgi:XTP/dITP diphosphohydrolase
MKILVATSNPHKLEEIRAVFATLPPLSEGIELVGLDTLGKKIDEPEENQDTFEGNAALKASYYAQKSGLLCLADDSGLEVDALGGEPGVRSARYAGVAGPRNVVDPANNKLLLEKLSAVPAEKRTARFVCAMAFAGPQSRSEPLAVVRGTVEGRIIADGESPRGTNGFGYDPLFLLPGVGKTTAELTQEEKNRISHRGRASRKMWEALREVLPKLAPLPASSRPGEGG